MSTLDFTDGSGSLDFTRPAPSARTVGYDPTSPGNWAPPPDNVSDALDQLAASGGGGGGGGGTPGNLVTRSYMAGIQVRDAVFVLPSGLVDRASASGEATTPAIGFVVALDTPSPGLCSVQVSGDLGGFSGLTPGKVYLISKSAGQVIPEGTLESDPNFPSQTGEVVQPVGVAASATVLGIMLELGITN